MRPWPKAASASNARNSANPSAAAPACTTGPTRTCATAIAAAGAA
jgi:hypothetical protein